ncbi:rhodanese-like domain-containing protein [Paenibacillus sp. MMO-177]|uniref:rhodanese-like domain-containing protein n=1 Tax=Paenibacillus sp. MMO-177 TaxID=3081289 RepID=UPI003019734C
MAFQVTKTISPAEVAEKLKQGETLYMVDVREPNEWAAGHVEGAKHIPLGQLGERLHELDPSAEIIMICRSGNRSGLACELLSEKGFNVVNMTGGLNAWTSELV